MSVTLEAEDLVRLLLGLILLGVAACAPSATRYIIIPAPPAPSSTTMGGYSVQSSSITIITGGAPAAIAT